MTLFVDFPGRSVGFWDYLLNIPFINGFISFPYVDSAHWYITMWLGCVFVFAFINNRNEKDQKWWYLVWLIFFVMLTYLKSEPESTRGVVAEILFRLIGGKAQYFPIIMIGTSIHLIQKKEDRIIGIIIALICFCLYYKHSSLAGVIWLLITLALFVLALWQKLGFLKWKPFQVGGMISFSVYIIHQNLGFMFMNGVCALFGDYSPWISVLALLMVLLLGFFVK